MPLQKFIMLAEENNRAIPVPPINNWNARLAAPNNVSLDLPPGTRMVRVSSLSADVYLVAVKTGTPIVAVPTGSVTDGSAPDFVAATTSEMFVVIGMTKLALISTGDVYVTAYA